LTTHQLMPADRAPKDLVDKKLAKLRKRESELVEAIKVLEERQAADHESWMRECDAQLEAEEEQKLREEFDRQEAAAKDARYKQWKRARNH